MIQQSTNVVHKQRVQLLGDFLLVGELQGALEGNPDTLQVHRTNLDHVSVFLALQNAVATTARHASNIEQLGTVDHVVIFTSCNADAFRFNLEAKATLVFPKRRSHSRLHAMRRNLSGRVKGCARVLALSRTG